MTNSYEQRLIRRWRTRAITAEETTRALADAIKRVGSFPAVTHSAHATAVVEDALTLFRTAERKRVGLTEEMLDDSAAQEKEDQ